MSVNKGQSARALVEPLALDSRTLGDADLSALSLSHNNEQYSSNDFEAFANIQAELECMNAEEVMTTDEEHIIIERNIETETIVPDVEMTEVSEHIQEEHIIYTTANPNNQNILFQAKPTLQRLPASAVQVQGTNTLILFSPYLYISNLRLLIFVFSTGETECWPDNAKSIYHDSIACWRPRNQSNFKNFTSIDCISWSITIISSDSYNSKIC